MEKYACRGSARLDPARIAASRKGIQPRLRSGTEKREFFLERPHSGDNGRGVNRSQYREEGICKNEPHSSKNEQSVNCIQYSESGIPSGEPPCAGHGEKSVEETIAHDYAASFGFHPMTMPDLRRGMHRLAARPQHVRILRGDWKRAVANGVLMTLPVGTKGECTGVFLDPPYSASGRDDNLYAIDTDAAAEVHEWCKKTATSLTFASFRPDSPEKGMKNLKVMAGGAFHGLKADL